MSDFPDPAVVTGMEKVAEAASMLRWARMRAQAKRGRQGIDRWRVIVASLERVMDLLADREAIRRIESSQLVALLETGRLAFPEYGDWSPPEAKLEDVVAAILLASGRLAKEVGRGA